MQPKAKYKLSADAVQDLTKLSELEEALKTMTANYNELRQSVWARIRKGYYLEEGKQYRFNAKTRLIEEM